MAQFISDLLPELKACFTDETILPTVETIYGPLYPDIFESAQDLNAQYLDLCSHAATCIKNIRFAPMNYLYLCARFYRLTAFEEMQDKLSDAQYWRCLSQVWSDAEHGHGDKQRWLKLFHSKRRYRKLIMSRSDRISFTKLPERITIYRGYQRGEHEHRLGLSWTLSKKVAKFFAWRRDFQGTPSLISAKVLRDKVICYDNSREEQEIIIDISPDVKIRDLL